MTRIVRPVFRFDQDKIVTSILLTDASAGFRAGTAAAVTRIGAARRAGDCPRLARIAPSHHAVR
jgi:hypothetical protein